MIRALQMTRLEGVRCFSARIPECVCWKDGGFFFEVVRLWVRLL